MEQAVRQNKFLNNGKTVVTSQGEFKAKDLPVDVLWELLETLPNLLPLLLNFLGAEEDEEADDSAKQAKGFAVIGVIGSVMKHADGKRMLHAIEKASLEVEQDVVDSFNMSDHLKVILALREVVDMETLREVFTQALELLGIQLEKAEDSTSQSE